MEYKRILIKISGESLAGTNKNGFDLATSTEFLSQIVELKKNNCQICIVIGGGNIIRGAKLSEDGISRVTADHMGMLGTMINALFLQDILEKKFSTNCRVMSAIPAADVCEQYINRRALRHLEKERIVIFAAGIGNPFFSSDIAAVLRALEMKCDVIFKGTKTNGVYSCDPELNDNAVHYAKISYNQILEKNLKIMDAAAIATARDHNMPIIVFSILKARKIIDVVKNRMISDCTLIN